MDFSYIFCKKNKIRLVAMSRSPSPAPSGRSESPRSAPLHAEPDWDELPFRIEDVEKKIYVLKGKDGGLAIEWNECSDRFLRKQGYGNAVKLTKKSKESTEEFICRAYKIYKDGQTHYNQEGVIGDAIKKFQSNHILIRMTVAFILFSVVGGIIFYILHIVYVYMECYSLFNMWSPMCSMMDRLRAQIRDNFITFQYLFAAQVMTSITALGVWFMSLL